MTRVGSVCKPRSWSRPLPATVVVGTQWGDEGKGKFTDLLARDMDMVVRYQGGHNAGHTLVVEGRPSNSSWCPAACSIPT